MTIYFLRLDYFSKRKCSDIFDYMHTQNKNKLFLLAGNAIDEERCTTST